MAKILRVLGLQRGDQAEIETILDHITRRRAPVLMEIEGTQIHFRSVLTVKRGVVVIAKPAGIAAHLKKDTIVRFAVPGDETRALRLTVISPHFNLSSGSSVMLCRIPEDFSEGARRKHMRFNTSRFNNLHLYFPDLSRRYRIVDLSTNGCKVYVNESMEDQFPLGDPIKPAQINISTYLTQLDAVVPRVYKGKTVGCEFTYEQNSESHKYIHHLITSLQKNEEAKLSAVAL